MQKLDLKANTIKGTVTGIVINTFKLIFTLYITPNKNYLSIVRKINICTINKIKNVPQHRSFPRIFEENR